MNARRAARARRSWMVFGLVAAVLLGAAVTAAAASGDRSNVGLVVLGGLIVLGIASALLHAMISPTLDGGTGGQASHGHWFLDGGGSGGGDSGGGHGGDGGC